MVTPLHRPRSIATVSLSGTLPEKLEAAAGAGFDGVELFENDLLTFGGSPGEVARIAAGLGLTLVLFQPFRDFEAMPPPLRQANLDRAERKFDLMHTLGIRDLLVCSSVHPAAIDDPARAAADLAEMAGRAGRRGLRVGYEALAWGRHTRTWRDAWRIVREANHPALGLVLDSFHTLALGDDLTGVDQVPAEKLFFVQLADAPLLAMDPLSWSRHYRNFPGQGALDVAGFTRAVLAAGYDGPLSLEIFNDDFRAAPAPLIARDGMRALVLLEEAAGERVLPALPTLGGFAFLEFAVDAPGAEKLGETLTGLGFGFAGTHRSKAVSLYRRDAVNLVLNAEPDSTAAGHFQIHGPSVCAIGLRVDDTARTLARAASLCCPVWREQIGEGARKIPALSAPDGTLVFLVDDQAAQEIWAEDFILTDEAPGNPGACRIDHVAQALPAGRMDGFVLFYRALFGLEPEPVFELPDPYGLVQSRAMRSADGQVRLPLNISESGKTATGRFVSAFAGAGVHHVAFGVADAAQAAAACARAGIGLLPIPENYYADLEARHGLDAETLAVLRTNQLLYDREAGGVFRHAYTDAFEDRFFFELVERRHYGGYGAVNAGVRMAAQAARRARA